MRYYNIVITDTAGKEFRRYTSFVNNQTLPGALQVEMDLPIAGYATPKGAGYVKIWGIPITDVMQQSDFNGKKIKVYGGLQPGLPLATAAAKDNQAGLLITGLIQQAFGNWQGVNMTLDLVIQPSLGSSGDPKNIVLDWKKGTTMAAALDNTFRVAFPDLKRQINLDPKLVFNQDQPGVYESLPQLAGYLKSISQAIIGGSNYAGVSIIVQEDKIIAWDGSSKTTPKEIKFTDLIGQPTWMGAFQINFKCNMRADIQPSSFIKMPFTQSKTTANSYSQYRQQSLFQGEFQVDFVRHVGSYRQRDAQAWNTSFDAHRVL